MLCETSFNFHFSQSLFKIIISIKWFYWSVCHTYHQHHHLRHHHHIVILNSNFHQKSFSNTREIYWKKKTPKHKRKKQPNKINCKKQTFIGYKHCVTTGTPPWWRSQLPHWLFGLTWANELLRLSTSSTISAECQGALYRPDIYFMIGRISFPQITLNFEPQSFMRPHHQSQQFCLVDIAEAYQTWKRKE